MTKEELIAEVKENLENQKVNGYEPNTDLMVEARQMHDYTDIQATPEEIYEVLKEILK